MRVQLGNTSPHEVVTHDDVKRRGLKVSDYDKFDEGRLTVPIDVEDAVTNVGPFPDGTPLSEALRAVADLWKYHSSEPPGWVASDSANLASLLAEEYGCDVKELTA